MAAVLGAVTTVVACGAAQLPHGKEAVARRLIEDALAAKGGQARLEKLKAIRLTGEGMSLVGGRTISFETTRLHVFPDKMRIDATIAPRQGSRQIVSVGISDESGWQRTPDPKTSEDVVLNVTGSGLQTLKFECWRQPEQILLAAYDSTARLELAPDETIGNNTYSVVKLRSPFGEVDVSLYINKRTKLLGRISYSDGSVTDSDDFADYREVKGVRVAYKVTSSMLGRTSILEIKSARRESSRTPVVSGTYTDRR